MERKNNKCQASPLKPCGNEAEFTIKDGSREIYVCDKCYYCSKCKTGQAIANSLVVEDKTLYQGSICETCILKLIKEKEETKGPENCSKCHQPMKIKHSPEKTPDPNPRGNYCSDCIQKYCFKGYSAG
jgi:hypothetical protein